MHGNATIPEDLKAALGYRVGRVVLDSFDEIEQVAALARAGQRVLVRVTPGVDGHTHPAVSTGVDARKFGFSLFSDDAAEAVRRVLARPELKLAGLHCHIGSQIERVADYEEAARRMLRSLAQLRDEHGVALPAQSRRRACRALRGRGPGVRSARIRRPGARGRRLRV